MKVSSKNTRLLIHWPRFGPYHRARLQSAVEYCEESGVIVSGLEIASSDLIYSWREENTRAQPIYRLFPGRRYETIPIISLWLSLDKYLRQVQPNAIAINGYTTKSARLLLLWCKLHHCSAILMSESKIDDSPRQFGNEILKGFLVRSYDAYLCGGIPHKAYLKRLGAPPERIFMGYDAVDNSFFWQQSQQARHCPDKNHHLPGLNDPRPFFLASSRFIPRKNLLGLLRAYRMYQQKTTENGLSPWRLIILGDGPQRSEVEAFIHEYDLHSWISLPGFRQIEELPAYYGTARVFIHPALQEQWGLVVNEAMASGLPVLVSDRCGCAPDLVLNGENGFIFSPDDMDALTNLMLTVSIYKGNLCRMGEASLRIISEWGLNRFAEGLNQALMFKNERSIQLK